MSSLKNQCKIENSISLLWQMGMADELITVSTLARTATTKSIKMQVLRGASISLKPLITPEVTSATCRRPSEPDMKWWMKISWQTQSYLTANKQTSGEGSYAKWGPMPRNKWDGNIRNVFTSAKTSAYKYKVLPLYPMCHPTVRDYLENAKTGEMNIHCLAMDQEILKSLWHLQKYFDWACLIVHS